MKNKLDGRHIQGDRLKLICAQLLQTNHSDRFISKMFNVAPNTVGAIGRKIVELGITKVDELNKYSNHEVAQLFYKDLYTKKQRAVSACKYSPDYAALAKEVIDRKIEIKQLYQEYCIKAEDLKKDAFSFSYFSAQVKTELDELKALNPDYYLAQDFTYGTCMEIDFSGSTYELSTYNGKVKCWLMVLCWPASYYTYAEFVTSQSTAESCRVIGNAIRHFENCIPEIVICDNAKCFVTKHSGQEALINQNFERFINELGSCVEAAPPYKPQRKSACEFEVGQCQNMMDRIFTDKFFNTRTLREHSIILQECVDTYINMATFRGSDKVTRNYLFVKYEKPACNKTLAITKYLRDAKDVKVPRSYLIKYGEHSYSVPYVYINQTVQLYVGNDEIIIKSDGVEIARHVRDDRPGRTVDEKHMPQDHKNIKEKNRVYSTTDDVLAITKELDDGLYKFCASRIKYDQEHRKGANNTIKCCCAVISQYKKSHDKAHVSQACLDVLQLPPELWHSHKVKELTEQIDKEALAREGSFAQQTSLQLIKTDDAKVHMRYLDTKAPKTSSKTTPKSDEDLL